MKKDYLSFFLGLVISGTFFFNDGFANLIFTLVNVIGIRDLTMWSYSFSVLIVTTLLFGLLEVVLPKFKRLHFWSYGIGFLFAFLAFVVIGYFGTAFYGVNL